MACLHKVQGSLKMLVPESEATEFRLKRKQRNICINSKPIDM